MAKAKKESPKSESTKMEASSSITGNEAMVIDIQPFLTPLSILISSIIIAASIFFSLRGVSLTTGTTTTGLGTQPTPTADTSGTAATGTTTLSSSPVMGNKSSAKVAIVEYSDMECPYCKTFHTDTFPQIKADYIDTGKAIFIYRNFPLSFHEPQASIAAEAAECARAQGGDDKYYAFQDLYFKATQANGQGLPSGQTIGGLMTQIGLDKTKAQACIDAQTYKDTITKDTTDGTTAGVNGTPSFVIGQFDAQGNVNGVAISGAQPYASFKSAIEAQLAR